MIKKFFSKLFNFFMGIICGSTETGDDAELEYYNKKRIEREKEIENKEKQHNIYKVFEVIIITSSAYDSESILVGANNAEDLIDHINNLDMISAGIRINWKPVTVPDFKKFTKPQIKIYKESLDPNDNMNYIREIPNMFTDIPYIVIYSDVNIE